MAFRAPRGTSDRLPEEQPAWRYVSGVAESVAASFGYGRIDTPLFEDTSLFTRGVGQETEIVEHQMYSFEDLGGDSISLKPESTAAVCRAYIQHGMHNQPQPVRLYYLSPHFRYERPQAGRVRQHHQFGVEAIGDESPQVDAEVIELGWTYLSRLGLKSLALKINSIGDGQCRPAYLNALREFFADREDAICGEHRRRYKSNPLRVLDCKKPECVALGAEAPRGVDHLCGACQAHWDGLLSSLDDMVETEALLPYSIDSRMVRGLDYYTRTVFEFQPAIEGSQTTLLGGGRYDPLIALLGGPETPGIGFGSGIERAILNLQAQGVDLPVAAGVDIVAVHVGDTARRRVLALASELRALGRSVIVAPEGRGMRAQMRYANAMSAKYALIVGERDMERGAASLRPLGEGGEQVEVALDAGAISAAAT